MQDPCVMAFRKRLKKRGYTDVSIKFDKEKEIYIVSGKDPLSGTLVSADYGYSQMFSSFRF